MRKVSVELPGRSYEVVIGARALVACTDRLRDLTEKPSAIIADSTVLALYEDRLQEALPGLPIVPVPPGERAKSWASFESVSEALLRHGVERGGAVVAFGGGVTGDLAGFCAATLRRGCKLIQIPTTLLSQVDSSVGGKTAINTRAGKNLVGAFHQPSLVVIDTDLLESLPERELRAGYAEVVKAAVLGDHAFFSWLEEHGSKALASDPEALREAIARSVALKARIVAEDERETGRRALLNLGHTFGHAIEALGGYDGRVLHGEGVAAGIGMAARFSVREGHLDQASADRVLALLTRDGLPAGLSGLPDLGADAPTLLSHMRQDKKVEGGAVTLILLRALGEAFVAKNQDEAKLLDFLRSEVTQAGP